MSKSRILAVDDDSSHLSALRRILRRSHYEVITCTNPRQALQMAIADPPDLILLDVCMPCMSGHEFLHRLRRAQALKPGSPTTPVIFLSGLTTSHHRVNGLNAGAEDYVTKPYDAEELRARVRSQLRRIKQQGSSPLGEDEQAAALESEVQDLWTVLQGCESPLHALDSNLELAGLVRQPELRNSLLSQAKKEVRSIVDSLSKIAEKPRATEANDAAVREELSRVPTVLCVDDEPAVLHALERILRRYGCHVILAESGLAALEVLRREQIEVVICDETMPGMCGTEVLTQAKTISPQTSRVMLTGHCGEEVAMEAINQSEVFRLLTKPWTNTQVEQAVTDALGAEPKEWSQQFLRAEERLYAYCPQPASRANHSDERFPCPTESEQVLGKVSVTSGGTGSR